MFINGAEVHFIWLVIRIARIIDGDTFIMDTLITPDTIKTIKDRLDGWDTPENKSPASSFEKYQAKKAAETTAAFLNGPGIVRMEYMGLDDFGRTLANIWHEIGDIKTSLGQFLADQGLATKWPTRWHEVYDPLRNKTL